MNPDLISAVDLGHSIILGGILCIGIIVLILGIIQEWRNPCKTPPD